MKRTGESSPTSNMSIPRWRRGVAAATAVLTFSGIGGGVSACGNVKTSSGQYTINALPQESPVPYTKVDDPPIPQRACPDTIFASAGVVIYDPLVSEIAGKPGVYPRNIQSKGVDAATGLLQLDNGQPQDPGAHQWYSLKTHAKIPDNAIAGYCQSVSVDVEAVNTTTLGEVPMYVDEGFEPGGTYNTAPPAVFGIKSIRHIPLPPGCVPAWVEPVTAG